jgi:hypothetical protein
MTDRKHIEILAKATFAAWERLRALEMANTPTEYAARERAFIELAQARYDAAERQRILDDWIKHA